MKLTHIAWQTRLALGIVLVLMFTACGYRFSGSGQLPQDIQTLSISVFDNRTGEIGIETDYTNLLINEFILRRKDALTDAKNAEATLTGVINRIRERTVFQTAAGKSTDREVVVTVSVKLTRRDGVVIWSDNGITVRQTYPVGDSAFNSAEVKRLAILDAGGKLAENIFNRLTEDF